MQKNVVQKFLRTWRPIELRLLLLPIPSSFIKRQPIVIISAQTMFFYVFEIDFE